MSSRGFLIATFADPDVLMEALFLALQQGLSAYDVYSPYPIHGLDQAMGIRRTRLPLVTLLAGLVGFICALLFQFDTTALDWPIDVGGKPDTSVLPFVPVCFELTVLFAGLATVLALLVRARLYPGNPGELVAKGITNDTFALVLWKPDSSAGVHVACDLLDTCGAMAIDISEGSP
jgi:hypothetical protein